MKSLVVICALFSAVLLVSGQSQRQAGNQGGFDLSAMMGATGGGSRAATGTRGVGGNNLMNMAMMSGSMSDVMQDFMRCRMMARMGIPLQVCLMMS